MNNIYIYIYIYIGRTTQKGRIFKEGRRIPESNIRAEQYNTNKIRGIRKKDRGELRNKERSRRSKK